VLVGIVGMLVARFFPEDLEYFEFALWAGVYILYVTIVVGNLALRGLHENA